VFPGVLAIQCDQQGAARRAGGAFGNRGQLMHEVRGGIIAMPFRVREADEIGESVMTEEARQVAAGQRPGLVEQLFCLGLILWHLDAGQLQ
jgi:hypothetical protein